MVAHVTQHGQEQTNMCIWNPPPGTGGHLIALAKGLHDSDIQLYLLGDVN